MENVDKCNQEYGGSRKEAEILNHKIRCIFSGTEREYLSFKRCERSGRVQTESYLRLLDGFDLRRPARRELLIVILKDVH